MYRMMRWFVLVTIGWLLITVLPGLARYLRMRQQ